MKTQIIKYNRDAYKEPEYLWTDKVSLDELRGCHEEYNNDNPEDIPFDDWLEMEQSFEQEFAIQRDTI